MDKLHIIEASDNVIMTEIIESQIPQSPGFPGLEKDSRAE
jgi:hypothetical protein